MVIWCVFYRTRSLFALSATCSSNVRHSFVSSSVSLRHTQSHSAIILTDESITYANATGGAHAANGGAGHAPTCAYRLVSFHLPTLADTILRFSHCISTYSNDALNPPRVVASATHASNSQRNSNPNPDLHPCECFCDSHPVRSYSDVGIALFVFVIVQPPQLYSHHELTPARSHAYLFIAYKRAVHTLMALFSAPRRRMFRLLLGLDVGLSSTYIHLLS